MSQLREIGLTEYEEKIYLTLLKEGSLTGGKVSSLSKVPHGRTYEVLQRLSKKGFVSILPIKPKIFKAIDPKIAIKELIEENIRNLQELVLTVPKELQKLTQTRIIKERVGEMITIVSGKENMQKIIKNSIDSAENYVKSMFTYEFEPYSMMRAQDAAMKRGVTIKHIATKLTKQGIVWMKRDIKRGIDVRYYPVEELRITVRDGIDSFQTMLNPRNPKDRVTIFIESSELTKALEHYFDKLWKKAKKIEDIKQKNILMG